MDIAASCAFIPSLNINIVIEDQTFHIIEIKKKGNTKEIISKIDYIFRWSLQYDQSKTDLYSILNQNELHEHLKIIANLFIRAYQNKIEDSFPIVKSVKNSKYKSKIIPKSVSISKFSIHSNSENIFFLPEEIVQKILSYLQRREFVSFAQASISALKTLEQAVILRAQVYNHTGTSFEGAKNHLILISKFAKDVKNVTDFVENHPDPDFIFSLSKYRQAQQIIDAKNKFNVDCFYDAIRFGEVVIVRELLLKGIDPNMRFPRSSNKTALCIAIKCDQIEIVSLLLKNKSDPNLDYSWLGVNFNSEIIHLLLENGLNPNAQDNRGHTAIHYTVIYCNTEILKLFLSYNADPNTQDFRGYTALHHCLANMTDTRLNFFKVLLSNGANLHIPNHYNEYPVTLPPHLSHLKHSFAVVILNHLLTKKTTHNSNNT